MDVCEIGTRFPEHFDLICLFNAFYAFKDKAAALQSLRKSAKTGARLCLFDYVWYKPEIQLPELMLSEKPSTMDEYPDLFRDSKWELSRSQNLDQNYVLWYRRLLKRFDALAETRHYTAEIVEQARKKYSDLLHSLESGAMGGVLIVGYANE